MDDRFTWAKAALQSLYFCSAALEDPPRCRTGAAVQRVSSARRCYARPLAGESTARGITEGGLFQTRNSAAWPRAATPAHRRSAPFVCRYKRTQKTGLPGCGAGRGHPSVRYPSHPLALSSRAGHWPHPSRAGARCRRVQRGKRGYGVRAISDCLIERFESIRTPGAPLAPVRSEARASLPCRAKRRWFPASRQS